MMNKSNHGPDRQREIYLGGTIGQKPMVPVDTQALMQQAQKKMSREAFAYVAGGAGQETTLSANRQAFETWRIVPRMLRDVSERDTSVTLFGQTIPSPLLLAPIGVLEMAHPHADVAVARAAAETGIPFIFSNQASFPMEVCADVMGHSPRWFQLYWSKSDELVASLVSRAEASGCQAIVVTLDTTLLGWRIRDLDLAYLPFLRGKGIAQYVTDPVFQRLMRTSPLAEDSTSTRQVNLSAVRTWWQIAHSYPGSFLQNLRSGDALRAIRLFINIYSRPSLTWDNITFLRQHTRLPILLKGILHADDAQQALNLGIDGLIVSNHGGRQVDGAVGSLEALPGVVAVAQKKPVLLDSGIRTGADVFKALALGATAVCLGRPYVYGLALAGRAGVASVIHNLTADFDLTMGLAGCRTIADISKDVLVPKGA